MSVQPPRFPIRHQDFVSFLDCLVCAPHAHSKLPTGGFQLFKGCVGFEADPTIIIDKTSFVSHPTCVYTDARTIRRTVQREIIIRVGSVIAVHFAEIVNDKCPRRYFLDREQTVLAIRRMYRVGDRSDSNKRTACDHRRAGRQSG